MEIIRNVYKILFFRIIFPTIIIYSGPSFIFLVNFFFYQVRAPHRNLATHVLLTRAASINNQTEIVNGERGHYLVWSVKGSGLGLIFIILWL